MLTEKTENIKLIFLGLYPIHIEMHSKLSSIK